MTQCCVKLVFIGTTFTMSLAIWSVKNSSLQDVALR